MRVAAVENSEMRWRQPPQGMQGFALGLTIAMSAIVVSPTAIIAAIAPASAQVPTG